MEVPPVVEARARQTNLLWQLSESPGSMPDLRQTGMYPYVVLISQ